MHSVSNSKPEGKELMQYKIVVPLQNGYPTAVTILGVTHITENTNLGVNIKVGYNPFPDVPAGALERSQDHVGLIICQNQAALLPSGGDGREKVDNL